MTPITSVGRIACTVLILAACACGPVRSDGGPAVNASVLPSAAAAPRMTLPDGSPVPITNFGKVDAGLYRGAQPDEEGFRALRDLGVRTVVSFRRFHDEDREDAPAGMEVVEIPMKALVDSDPPTDDEVRAFFDVVLDPAKRPVYVHCAHGKDRTGTMCAVYRMEVDGWTPERAFEEMQAYGFHDMYVDLERYVRAYTPRFAERVRTFPGAR